MVQDTAVAKLRARVSSAAHLRAHPDVAERSIDPPIVIIGGWRTGTTYLFRLLATDPRLRAPLPAELSVPWKVAGHGRRASGGVDRRQRRGPRRPPPAQPGARHGPRLGSPAARGVRAGDGHDAAQLGLPVDHPPRRLRRVARRAGPRDRVRGAPPGAPDPRRRRRATLGAQGPRPHRRAPAPRRGRAGRLHRPPPPRHRRDGGVGRQPLRHVPLDLQRRRGRCRRRPVPDPADRAVAGPGAGVPDVAGRRSCHRARRPLRGPRRRSGRPPWRGSAAAAAMPARRPGRIRRRLPRRPSAQRQGDPPLFGGRLRPRRAGSSAGASRSSTRRSPRGFGPDQAVRCSATTSASGGGGERRVHRDG